MDENELGTVIDNVESLQDANNINISDVIEVIETDLDFKQSTMFNGGGEIPQLPSGSKRSIPKVASNSARVVITEQPASKALRFRYECEGRSAGSIPGVSSTPENKTFPSIQIVGYRGRAVVVVSCVTKDAPYRPHPHNLVGREGCRKGVCTLEVSPETMSVTFSNLGIQCVKKKDIEAALRVREEIRVDPFRTGFSHRNQPTSIDLNAVRLCFQVFLEGDGEKFTIPLSPVVSDTIFDKKAMCDLVIIKLSDCVSYVDGGRKDIILLCEKVAKEDIQVRFYEEKDGQVLWEGFGDFQPSQVHKQTAIWFRAPKYKSLEVTEPVKVFVQLRRPSDGATSDPLPFEYLPLDSGRANFWPLRRKSAKKLNYELFNTLLANDTFVAKRQLLNSSNLNNNTINVEPEIVTHDIQAPVATVSETQNNDSKMKENEKNINKSNVEEKSFKDLIDQVAELDEIYSETQTRLLNLNNMNIVTNTTNEPQLKSNDSFDDAQTYSSLQLAFKNPVQITDMPQNMLPTAPSLPPPLPVPPKRENEIEKLPPLPPKRVKKIETAITGSSTSIQLSEKQAENLLQGFNQKSNKPNVSRSQSFNLPNPKQQTDIKAPLKQLPCTPSSTLPNPKKPGFFAKLFGKKNKSQSVNTLKRTSFSSAKSLQVDHLNTTHSIGNLSTQSCTDAVSIHIPLRDPSPEKMVDVPENGLVQETNIPTDIRGDENMNLDLTEAEHYALYTAMAPHATQSEFDEMSCYYAPVEGGKIYIESDGNNLISKT